MKKPNITKGDWHREYNSCYQRKGKEYSRYSIKDSTGKVVAWHVEPIDAKAISAVPEMIDTLIECYQLVSLLENEPEYNETKQKIVTTLLKAGVKL